MVHRRLIHGSVPGQFVVSLSSVWGWLSFGPVWCQFGVSPGASVRGQLGVSWGSVSCNFGVSLVTFGVALGTVWDKFRMNMGPTW